MKHFLTSYFAFVFLYFGVMVTGALAQQNGAPLPSGLIRDGDGSKIPPMGISSNNAGVDASTPQLQSFSDWVHRCSDTQLEKETVTQCELLQVRQIKQGETMVNILILAIAEIASEKKEEKPAILLTTVVPLDVFLPEGIRFLIDGREMIHIPYQNCNNQGCWSRAILDDKVIEAFRKGNNGLARFAVINGQGAEIQFSLKGFTAGITALQNRS